MDNPKTVILGNRFLPREEWREQAFYETYKSQIALLNDGLKLLGLANGGAAVALMTLIGASVTRCSKVPNMTDPIGAFSYGLVAVIVAYFLSYLSQVGFLKYLDTERNLFKLLHIIYFSLGTFAVAAAVATFVLGVTGAVQGFAAFKCN